ncbi:MAG: leucine-rich repeat domain-containing protein [Treponema sp.]|jgi:hypothetical protein|nr:leucine-rich repeat domain-containing protein [Treponema sp.]
MKKMYFGFITIVVFMALSLAACPEGDSGSSSSSPQPPPPIVTNNLKELGENLTKRGKNTADKPVQVKLNGLNLDTNWTELLKVLDTADRYVDLDISECTGMTTFAPGAKNTGEKMIVSLVLPKTTETISAGTDVPQFLFFSSLRKIKGTEITEVGDYSFYNTKTLSAIDFPVLNTIGEYAFAYSGLTGVTIPAGVSTVKTHAFYGCTGLTSLIIFEDGLETIESYAFYAARITSLTIPDSVTNIEENAFAQCASLTGITIGGGLENMDGFVFGDYQKLEAINVSEDNMEYSSQNGVLYNSAANALIRYPAGKKGAFTVPDGVTSIKNAAFSGCTGLTGVTIGADITGIENYAFEGCSGLTSVTFKKNTLLFNNTAFPGDLFDKFITEGIGTYTRPNGNTMEWTKQGN